MIWPTRLAPPRVMSSKRSRPWVSVPAVMRPAPASVTLLGKSLPAWSSSTVAALDTCTSSFSAMMRPNRVRSPAPSTTGALMVSVPPVSSARPPSGLVMAAPTVMLSVACSTRLPVIAPT